MLLSHFAVLNHLIRVADGRTPLELARAFQVPKTTMTHTLAGLERAGYVAMRRNEQDGRSKRVWITEEGRAFRDGAVAAMAPDFVELNGEFPVDKVRQIVPHLECLRKIMDARR